MRADPDPCHATAGNPANWPWVRAYPIDDVTEAHGAYTGKWLIWVRCRGVQTCWSAVRAATEAGGLGIAAKIRAHRSLPVPRRSKTSELQLSEIFPPQELHVVCVYTRDWRDIDNVRHIGAALAEIGAVRGEVIRYKSDEQTLSGIYYGSGQSVTLYNMRPPYTTVEAGAGLRSEWARSRHAAAASRILTTLEARAGSSSGARADG